jgi:hypothetical protein
VRGCSTGWSGSLPIWSRYRTLTRVAGKPLTQMWGSATKLIADDLVSFKGSGLSHYRVPDPDLRQFEKRSAPNNGISSVPWAAGSACSPEIIRSIFANGNFPPFRVEMCVRSVGRTLRDGAIGSGSIPDQSGRICAVRRARFFDFTLGAAPLSSWLPPTCSCASSLCCWRAVKGISKIA